MDLANLDIRRWIDLFLIAFVIAVIIMIVFVARMVSVLIAKNNTTSFVSTVAEKNATTPRNFLKVVTILTFQLTQLTETYLDLSVEEQEKKLESLINLAEDRKLAYISLIEENPAAALTSIFPELLRNQLPAEVQQYIEEKALLLGTLQKQTSNVNQDQSIQINYSLITNTGDELKLFFPENDPLEFETNEQVRIQAVRVDNFAIVESLRKTSF